MRQWWLFPCLFLWCIAWFIPQPVYAFGIAPSYLEEIVPPGVAAVREHAFYITRGDAREDEEALITFSGEAARFVELPKGNIIELSPGSQRTPVTVIFRIPSNLSEKSYHGNFIVIKRKKSTSGQSGSGVQIGLQGEMRVIVSQPAFEKQKKEKAETEQITGSRNSAPRLSTATEPLPPKPHQKNSWQLGIVGALVILLGFVGYRYARIRRK